MKNASPGPALKAFVLCTFLFMVAMNVLAVLLPLNGVTPGEVSDSYPNLFAPAGAAFAIWTLIYLLLAAHTLYQLGWLRGPGAAPEGGLPCPGSRCFSPSPPWRMRRGSSPGITAASRCPCC
jgi:hypothetical protein